MSPNDWKAIKLCAKLMSISDPDYNPIENDAEADAIVTQFGLTVTAPPSVVRTKASGLWDISDGKNTVRFGGMTRNHAIVEGICALRFPLWHSRPSKRGRSPGDKHGE